MAIVSADVSGPSDAELIESVRSGETSAYGSLYERHVNAAYNLARQLTRSSSEADDLVAEAFAKVLDSLKVGRGPDEAFRAYLLTTLRNTAYDKTRRDRKLQLADDVSEVASAEMVSIPFQDTAVSGLERSLAAKAFATLPERWQAVLWHTEIEGQSPAEIAPILGLTANGVSALAYRAREGLRQAYLQVHLAESTAVRCKATVDRLGAWTRGGLSKRETAQVEAHLDECARCRALAAELADVNGSLRVVLAPLVLGVGAAGYLATVGAGTAKAAVVVGAAASAAAAGTATGAGTAASGSTSAGGAAGAASSLPRQVLGVAASTAALGVAVAVALTSGGTAPIPAIAAPPPAASRPAPPAPAPPPAAPKPQPSPNPPPASATPTPTPTPPTTVAPSTTTPAPGKSNLAASAPPNSVTLVPGGSPVELPITVRNTGNGTSDPITMALSLPSGVTASLANSAISPNTASSDQASPRALPRSQPVSCTGGHGSIQCSTATGLAPNQSLTVTFELAASPQAAGGQITGTISAGTEVNIQLGTVDVQVNQVDAIDLTATAYHGFWGYRIETTMTNSGTHSGTATLTITAPRHGWLSTPKPCQRAGNQVICTVNLAPGERFAVTVWVHGWWWHNDNVQLNADLGSAHRQVNVPLVSWWPK